MGADIHAYAEKFDGWKWVFLEEIKFDRNYGLFAWLADVRNYSGIKPLCPSKGLPDNLSSEVHQFYEDWDCDSHNPSWYGLDELLAVDYSQIIEDRRISKVSNSNKFVDGGCTTEPGEGKEKSLRDFLYSTYFTELDNLKDMGADRIVFWFDN